MAILYVDSRGNERSRHSYSAGLEFDGNPYRYWLHRIQGWCEKDNKAALLFGQCLENAIEFYHLAGGKLGEEEFIRLWSEHREKELTYTKKEVCWDQLMQVGREMMRLYAIRQPFLPIPLSTLFQRQFTKEVFPGHPKYGGIEFYAKLDMIASAEPTHPMLPAREWKNEDGLFRPVIVDIKTSGIDLDDTTGIVSQDLQLRLYSWVYGKPDVAFLWFKKCGLKFKKGYSATMLADAGRFKAGEEVVVASVEKDGSLYLVGNDLMMEEMNKAQGYREGTKSLDTKNEAKERAAHWREENAVLTSPVNVTRQRLQFSAGMVDEKSAQDAGAIAADQIVRIVNSWETNRWTNKFGIRFPHDDRKDLYFRAFCLKDNALRDSIFTQKNEEDLNDYFEEPDGPEEAD